MKPARMQSCASVCWGPDGGTSVEAVTEAASSTVPAAVTHDRRGSGERKNTTAGIDVWVSSSSVNQVSQLSQRAGSRSSPSMRWWRMSSSAADGDDPARTSRAETAVSRRENDEYIEGR